MGDKTELQVLDWRKNNDESDAYYCFVAFNYKMKNIYVDIEANTDYLTI